MNTKNDPMNYPGVWRLYWKDAPATEIGGYSLSNAMANAGFNEKPKNLGSIVKLHGPRAKGVIAGDIVVLRGNEQHTESTLAAVFETVLRDRKNAWYVDYFTADAARFRVQYITEVPLIPWTNECLDDRDPKDPKGTQWESDDVTSWFSNGRNPEKSYQHTIMFTAGGGTHSLTLRAGHARIDAEHELSQRATWDRYVELGIRGALEPFLASFERLDGIRIEVLNEIAA